MGERIFEKEPFWNRIENKVFLIIALTTAATAIVVFTVIYSATRLLLVDDIRSRTKIVNAYANEIVDLKSFSLLNQPSDDASPLYQRQQQDLNSIRRIANVRYLFTAKEQADGTLVYLIDGLEQGADDFRKIGDAIEPEITAQLRTCLNGTLVESEDILNTEWGAIFFTCWPVKDEAKNTVGAVVMEFDAQNIYSKHRTLTFYSIFMCVILAGFFSFLARCVTKKVSVPFYKKLAYTDPLTGLNNRTAFELDLEQYDKNSRASRRASMQVADKVSFNDAAKKKMDERAEISLIAYDLDNLKLVNDELGHAVGDDYIRKMAEVITHSTIGTMGVTYRIGGDEFVTVVQGASNELEELLENMFTQSRLTSSLKGYFEFSYGICMFDPVQDKTLHDTLVRADKRMYAFKKKNKVNPCNLALTEV